MFCLCFKIIFNLLQETISKTNFNFLQDHLQPSPRPSSTFFQDNLPPSSRSSATVFKIICNPLQDHLQSSSRATSTFYLHRFLKGGGGIFLLSRSRKEMNTIVNNLSIICYRFLGLPTANGKEMRLSGSVV